MAFKYLSGKENLILDLTLSSGMTVFFTKVLLAAHLRFRDIPGLLIVAVQPEEPPLNDLKFELNWIFAVNL